MHQLTDEAADHTFSLPSYPPDDPHRVDTPGPQWASYLKGVVALMITKKGMSLPLRL